MIVGMHEHVGHMHDMHERDMRTTQTCGPSRHAISVTILLVSGVYLIRQYVVHLRSTTVDLFTKL